MCVVLSIDLLEKGDDENMLTAEKNLFCWILHPSFCILTNNNHHGVGVCKQKWGAK